MRPESAEDGAALWALRRADGFPVRGRILIESSCDLHEDHLESGERPRRIRNQRNIVLLESSAGGRVPARILLHSGLSAAGKNGISGASADRPCLIEIQPLRPLRYARKYIVGIRGLVDGRGRPIEFARAFARQRARPSHARREPTRRALIYLERYLRWPARQVQLALAFTTESRARPLGLVHALQERLSLVAAAPEKIDWRASKRAGFRREARGTILMPRICSRFPGGRCRIVSDESGLPRVDLTGIRVGFRLLEPVQPRSGPIFLLVNTARPATLDRWEESGPLLDLAYRTGLIVAALEMPAEPAADQQPRLRVDHILRGMLYDILFMRWLESKTDRAAGSRPRFVGLAREGRFAHFGMRLNPRIEALVVADARFAPGAKQSAPEDDHEDDQEDVYGLRSASRGSVFAPSVGWGFGMSATRASRANSEYPRAFFARELPLYFTDWIRPSNLPPRLKRIPVWQPGQSKSITPAAFLGRLLAGGGR